MAARIYGESPFYMSNVIKFTSLFLVYFIVRQWKADIFVWIALFISGIFLTFVGEYCFYNSGIYAGYLALSVLCGIGLLFKTPRWSIRLFIFAGILIITYSLINSESRSAWLAVTIGGMVMCGLKSSKCLLYLRTHKWLSIGVFLFIAGLVVALYFYKPDSANGRLLVWKAALPMAIHTPLVGSGADGFMRNYMYAQADYFRQHPDTEEVMLADNTWHAFNEILHLWCNWGLVGVSIIAVLACILLRNCPKCSYLPVGVLTGLLVFSCFRYPASFLSLSVFYLFLTSCVVNDAKFSNLHVLSVNRIQQWVIKSFCILGILGLGYAYYEHDRANRLLEELEEDKVSPVLVLGGNQCLFYEPDYVARLGKLCYRKGYYPEAVFVLERATLLRPTVEMFCDFGVSYARTGNFDEAERCFKQAVGMIPSRMLPRYRLFCLYRDKGLYAKAFDVAQQILGQRVKVVNSLTLDIKKEVKTFCEEHKNPGKMPCRDKG